MYLKSLFIAAAFVFSGSICAETNVALDKSVELRGSPFFSPLGIGWVAGKETVVDGVFLTPEVTGYPYPINWNQGPVWWVWDWEPEGCNHPLGGPRCSIEINLEGTFLIASFIFQGDSDTYFLDYWDVDDNTWMRAWTVYPGPWPYNGYVQVRPNPTDSTEKHVLTEPIITNRLRVMPSPPVWEQEGSPIPFPGTDHLYGVSELQAFGEPYVPPPDTIFSCNVFEPPLADGVIRIRGKRTLPVKAQLFDLLGDPITDLDIITPPVIQVVYESGVTDDAEISEAVLPYGQGTEGNQFFYDDDGNWHYNLRTKTFSASGTYSVFMESGDTDEYLIDPTCLGEFVIE